VPRHLLVAIPCWFVLANRVGAASFTSFWIEALHHGWFNARYPVGQLSLRKISTWGKGRKMRLRAGDRLRCSNRKRHLEMVVTDPGRSGESKTLLLCSCGSPMKKPYEKPSATLVKLAPYATSST
jgi:hypothetical protein